MAPVSATQRASLVTLTSFHAPQAKRAMQLKSNMFRDGMKRLQTFQRNVLQDSAYCFLVTGYLLGVLVETEDAGSTFFRNFGEFLPDYTASHSGR
jgi:hypothetical protein